MYIYLEIDIEVCIIYMEGVDKWYNANNAYFFLSNIFSISWWPTVWNYKRFWDQVVVANLKVLTNFICIFLHVMFIIFLLRCQLRWCLKTIQGFNLYCKCTFRLKLKAKLKWSFLENVLFYNCFIYSKTLHKKTMRWKDEQEQRHKIPISKTSRSGVT